MRRRILGIIGIVATTLATAPSLEGSGQDDRATVRPAEIRKILFLGNSITRHPPRPEIDWHDDWGMAATSADKDYVHLVAAEVGRRTGKPPEILVKNIADFERGYSDYDVDAKLKDAFAFDADLFVLAIGENVPEFKTDADADRFEASVAKILAGVRARRQPIILVRGCFWPSEARDARLRKASEAAGARFIEISSLGRDPSNAARSERSFKHEGVASHPGDRGMKAIAEAILAALDQTR
ncbi:SGNH/GDSL hydrolase family protein [Paludisphaera rhizosphaerae]|uniref:SGNH/GDSL hydrolase family protein n=1 Tax=Paludisphaera rhizosphaerae TaxID=2711216 RepID=UPI0013EBDCEA|nr:SGNH/GDSL hydrolase family protein [Paludisphaera rhizosphaerae]